MTTATESHSPIMHQLQKRLPNGTINQELSSLAAAAASNPVFSSGQLPSYIVQPADPDELQAVICFANEMGLNLTVTSSTGVHRNGGITNSGENVLIDLSGWRNIDLIDRRNRVCRIEPGVTYGQLLSELAKHNMTLPLPLAPRDGKSVLASVMDREPTTWPNKQWDSSDPAGSTELFFGNGERFRTGAAGGPGNIRQQRRSGGAQKLSSGPSQSDLHRVVQGAQGTMGILTWITLRAELRPTQQKTLLASCEQLEDLLPFVYAVQRGLLGEQTLILDRNASAMLLAKGSRANFDDLRAACPAYICLQNIAGFERLPQERLAYHLKDIRAFAQSFNLHIAERVGAIAAADLLDIATQPCGEIDWRDQLHGNSLSIFFTSTLDRTPAFHEIFLNTARQTGISTTAIGVYVQPIVQNHACHIEFIVPFDPASANVRQHMEQFERLVTQRLMDAGAFFSRPYGSAAALVWAQNPANYELVKVVKSIFDPNQVLQRGKWGL